MDDPECLAEVRHHIASVRGLPVVIGIVAWFATYLIVGAGLSTLFGVEPGLENMSLGGLIAISAALLSAYIAAPSVYWWVHSRPVWPNLKTQTAEMAGISVVLLGFTAGVLVLLGIGLAALGVVVNAVC